MRKPLGATLVWLGIAIVIFGILLIIDYTVFRATLFGIYHPPSLPSSSGNGPFTLIRPPFLGYSNFIGTASMVGGAMLFIYGKIVMSSSKIKKEGLK